MVGEQKFLSSFQVFFTLFRLLSASTAASFRFQRRLVRGVDGRLHCEGTLFSFHTRFMIDTLHSQHLQYLRRRRVHVGLVQGVTHVRVVGGEVAARQERHDVSEQMDYSHVH